MMHAPLLLLAIASVDICDLRAGIAGELMILRQSGAPAEAVAIAARRTPIPVFAGALLQRVLVAETASDPSARELAAFHFAAEVYSECHDSGPAGA